MYVVAAWRKLINFNKTLTYVKWIEGYVIKPWEMAVSQGFSDVWVYVDFEQKNADDIKGKETLNFVLNKYSENIVFFT